MPGAAPCLWTFLGVRPCLAMPRNALWALALACASVPHAGAVSQTPLPTGVLLTSTLLSRNNSKANDTATGFDNWLVPAASCTNGCVRAPGRAPLA